MSRASLSFSHKLREAREAQQKMVSKSMLGSLLKKQLSYTPEPQPYYTFHEESWQASTEGVSPASTDATPAVTSLHLITWNIDFMASHPNARMTSAVNYLEKVVENLPPSSAVVIFLQEMMESQNYGPYEAKDLSQLANASWVQRKFRMTDIQSNRWESPYGQATLVDRRLAVDSVKRLHFVSEYQRDALFVDVQLDSTSSGEKQKLLRLCNVHLDSSYGTMRPVQWRALAKHLQNEDEGVVASILAGDCNANQPRDKTEVQENGFKDAYLELGGVEGDEEGATWGFQSFSGGKWGQQRFDKEVFWGKVEVRMLERIGIGVQIEDEAAKREMENQGEMTFVTDHYGLLGVFELVDGLKIVTVA